MNAIKIYIVFFFLLYTQIICSQVYLSESFEGGARPTGWTEEMEVGTEPWRYRNGGHSPNDNNWQVPPDAIDIRRNPPSAFEGTYNAIFFKQGDGNERTKLITPAMDLLGGSSVELSFYLCQIPWTFEGVPGWDVLRIYYKVSLESEWVLLQEFLDPVYTWERKSLTLPNLSSTYYIAFEGQTRWGYGTCVDKITIEQTTTQPLYLGQVNFSQPFNQYIPSGSSNVPIMRVDLRIFGNTGTAILDHINFASLNTSDSDILPGGVKLYSTSSQVFNTDNLLGSPTDFLSGVASFSNLNHNLPPGLSYLWLTYDVSSSAGHENILDVKVNKNNLQVNNELFPASDQTSSGNRIIYETLYFQDFEGTPNWTLAGEFEVSVPNGLGASPGNPDPSEAFSGIKVLGTDLTGLGPNPYKYEPGLSESSACQATSPVLNMLYYTNLNLFYQRYMNIEVWDDAFIEASTDNGITWTPFWESGAYISDYTWTQERIIVPDEFSRAENFRIRFRLGPTSGQNNYSGWNIDDIYLTGEFITRDVGVSEWIYPQSGSGHTSDDSVTIRIRNFGGAPITDPVPVAYSFNGGTTWTVSNMNDPIPVGGSVVFTFPVKADLSAPGLRPSVLAKTMFSGDQHAGNDQIETQVNIVPTYPQPYAEAFEINHGYWGVEGTALWEYGIPAGSVINSASSGMKGWITGLNQKYGNILAEKSEIIFSDNFETLRGWSLAEGFEIGIPSNMQVPFSSFSPYTCLGVDLSGNGVFPYAYENGIRQENAYEATSPAFDVVNYSNLNISFMEMLAIQNGDSVKIEVSPNGTNWYTLWKNSQGEIMNTDNYEYRQYSLPDSLAYSHTLRIRFSLFYSDSESVAPGWFIDDFMLTGDLINENPSYLVSPNYDLSGTINPVWEAKLWTDTELNTDGANLQYSLDDGLTWRDVSNVSEFDSYWNWYSGQYVDALENYGWSGQSNGWISVRHLLPGEVIGQQNVRFRLNFMADKFNNDYDGIALDDVQIFESPHDVGVIDIISPTTKCELSPDEKFTLRIKNFGIRSLHTGDTIKVGYYIERSGVVQESEETLILTQPLAVGASREFNMSQSFDFSASGEYHTRVFTLEDDPLFYRVTANDTISRIIKVNKPAVELGPDISTVRPDTIVLVADEGIPGHIYLWQDGSGGNQFSVSTEGTYYVKVTNDLGCETTDSIEVMQLIPDVGISTLLTPVSSCELGSNVPVRVAIQNFGTDTLELNDTIFIHALINNSNHYVDTLYMVQRFYPGESREFLYSKGFDFTLPGIYNLKLYAKLPDDFDPMNDTLIYDLAVYGYPEIELGPDTIVQAAQYRLEPGAGYFEYLWQDGSTEETFAIDQPGQAKYKVTVSDEYGCMSRDSVNVTLNVIDISLDQILSPETSCGLTENIVVRARLKNSGNQIIATGNAISLSYSIDGGSTIQDVLMLSEDFMPGTTLDFEFSQVQVVETGKWYDFSVYLDYAEDMKSINDTVNMPVGIFASPVVDLGDNYQVVIAKEHILDAGPGFVSYEWQDGSGNQTFLVNKPGIGNYAVTVTDGNGCSTTEEVQIMLAVPDIGISAVIRPATTCDPEMDGHVEVTLKNFGNWDIEAGASIEISYSLNEAPVVTEALVLTSGLQKASTLNYVFTETEDLSLPGNYQLVAYTSFASDLIAVNDTMRVSADIFTRPLLDIGSGQDTIIAYEPVILSATPGYLSYEWQDGSSGTQYEISTPGAGIYSVLVTAESGCTNYDEVFVVYDSPDIEVTQINGPVSACKFNKNTLISFEIINNGYHFISTGENIGLTYTVNNGTPVTEQRNLSAELLPGEKRTLTFNTPYDFSVPGNYEVKVAVNYTSDLYLLNNELTTQVNNWGLPQINLSAGQDTLHTSLPVSLDAGPGYSNYLWQNNSTGQSLEASAYGLYWVSVTDENGCSARDSIMVTYPLSNGEISIGDEMIRIFPNPAEDYLNIEMSMEEAKEVVIEIYSVQNRLLYRKRMDSTPWLQTEINVQSFTPGFYYLKMMMDNQVYTYVVVVK